MEVREAGAREEEDRLVLAYRTPEGGVELEVPSLERLREAEEEGGEDPYEKAGEEAEVVSALQVHANIVVGRATRR